MCFPMCIHALIPVQMTGIGEKQNACAIIYWCNGQCESTKTDQLCIRHWCLARTELAIRKVLHIMELAIRLELAIRKVLNPNSALSII